MLTKTTIFNISKTDCDLLSLLEHSWQLSSTQPLLPLGGEEEKKGEAKASWVKIRGVYLNNKERGEAVVITMVKRVIHNSLLTATPEPCCGLKLCPSRLVPPYIYWA